MTAREADAPGEAVPGSYTLDTRLSGALGGRTAQALERAFGHRTVGDLLAHYPRRYALRGELTALASLPLDENVTIVAEVLEVRVRDMRQRRGSIVEAKISDGTGILTLTFFNQRWREHDLRPGRRGIFAGKVGDYKGARQLAHPDYELFDESVDLGANDVAARRWVEAPIPIYPATSTLASWQIAKSIAFLLDGLGAVDDPLPVEVRAARGLHGQREALEAVHRPEREGDWKAARRTLRFTEAFVLQTALLERRAELRTHHAVARRARPGGLLERFDAALPFTLTDDQVDVGAQISDDLEQPVPMNRLVQGEVGSGKTVVALRAMLAVADSGGQSALLAPTEVLAAQHLRSMARMLGSRALGRAHADAPHRAADGGRTQEGAAASRRGPVAHRRRHARAHRRPGLVRRPRPRRRRRAAPIRRRTARGAAPEGRRAARTCSCSRPRRSRAPSR